MKQSAIVFLASDGNSVQQAREVASECHAARVSLNSLRYGPNTHTPLAPHPGVSLRGAFCDRYVAHAAVDVHIYIMFFFSLLRLLA